MIQGTLVVLRRHQAHEGHWPCWCRAGRHPAISPMSAPGWGWASTTHPAAAIHTDIPFARLAGRAVYHGLLVLVVEALPLGDAGQLTLVWGWGRQGRKAEIPVRFKACPCHSGAWAGPEAPSGGRKSPCSSLPQVAHPSQGEETNSTKLLHLWGSSQRKITE